MVPFLRRRLLPAAFSTLAALGGVMLAVWGHQGPLLQSAAVSAAPAPAASAPQASRQPPGPAAAQPRQPQSKAAASTAEAPAGDPPAGKGLAADPAEQLESLRRDLNRRLDQDVEGALAALLALNESQRRHLAEDLVRRAAEQAGAVTLQWLDTNVADPALREQLLAAAYPGVARQDPIFAISQAQALTDPEARRLASHQVLEVWAEQDVVAAYEWMRGQDGAADLQVTVMQAYMETFPEQAGQLIAGLPGDETRDRLIDVYAFHLAGADPKAAIDWLTELGPEVPTHQAFGSVFDQWTRQDPWAALDFAATDLDGELGVELIGRVAAGMAASQPAELAGSFERVPEAYRTLAAHQLANTWAATEPDAARRWVDSLPAGDVRDEARRGLADALAWQRTPARGSG